MTHFKKHSLELFSAALLLVASLFLASCSSYGPEFNPYSSNGPAGVSTNSFESVKIEKKIPAEWSRAPSEPYRLGPGDSLTIELVGVANTQVQTFVTPDGRLYYQNVAGAKVLGMSLPELKEMLERDLAKWYHSPQVSVSLDLVKSQRVWVMGQVTKPGVYPLSRPTTLVEAISLAGGLSTAPLTPTTASGTIVTTNTEEVADLSRAFLIRDGKYVPVDFKALLRDGNMGNNIYLKNGDYIFLPAGAAKEVYVMGEVTNPRAVRYVEEMSLISAIANAGGTTKIAHVQNVVIIRGSLTEPKVCVVPYKDIATGEVRDVALQPHDIVWVPSTPWERLDKLVNDIVGTFVRTVAANEGSQFASPTGGRVGTSINVGQ